MRQEKELNFLNKINLKFIIFLTFESSQKFFQNEVLRMVKLSDVQTLIQRTKE